MQALSDDDLNLRGMSDEELAQAWNFRFVLVQHRNDFDSPQTHGVFLLCRAPRDAPVSPSAASSADPGMS